MSTQIVDRIVVLFGLDGSQFSAASDKAKKEAKSVGEESVKHVKKAEDSVFRLGKGIADVQRMAVSMLATFAGATGIVQFTSQVLQLESALDRLSDHTGQNTENLHAMANIAEVYGGKMEEAFSSAQRYADEMAKYKYLGEEGGMTTFMRRMNVNPVDSTNQLRTYNDVLLEVAANYKKGILSKSEFYTFARDAGIDTGTIDALADEKKAYKDLLQAQEKNALITKKQAEAARELVKQWTEMKQRGQAWGRDIFNNVMPYLEELFRWFKDFSAWLSAHEDFVVGSLTAIATVLAVVFAPAAISAALAIGPILLLALAIGLLWDDYQVWKRGGDSFLNWNKWMGEINPAIKAVGDLTSTLKDLFNSVDGKDKLVNFLKSIGNVIAQEFTEALNAISNVATALDLMSQGRFVAAARVLVSKESNAKIMAMSDEELSKDIPSDKLAWDMGIFGAFERIGNAALSPWRDKGEKSKINLNGNRPASTDKSTKAKQQYLRDLEKQYNLPQGVMDSVWYQESRRGKNAGRSSAGAEGDFQFMPATAKRFGVNVRDFHSSADGAAKYLSWLSNRYNGNISKMLAGYNAGEGNVDKYKGVPPFKETRGYVTEIMARMGKEKGNLGAAIPLTAGYPAGYRAQAALSQSVGNKSVTNNVHTSISNVNIHTSGNGEKIAQDFTKTLNLVGAVSPSLLDSGMD